MDPASSDHRPDFRGSFAVARPAFRRRDAHGKFTKCPPKPAAKAKPKQCRDAKGKFIKCK
jgi:hypothetical protein